MSITGIKNIENSDDITQGDLIENCSIILPNEETYNTVISEEDQEAESMIDLDIMDIDTVVVLSQACDLSNKKIDSVVLYKVWPLKELITVNEYYKSSKAKESLRQGKEPSYHLLNAYTSEHANLDFSVVDFHRIYTVPKIYLKKVAQSCSVRLRLLPPYREHLSQAFARYFMRVGLPSDINRNDIKNYQI